MHILSIKNTIYLLSIAVLVSLFAIVYQTHGQTVGSSTDLVLGGQGGINANSCTIATQGTVKIGKDSSTQILAAGRYAWVRIAQPVHATNTARIAFGATVTATTSTRLAPGATSTTPDNVFFGLDTDFPFTGAVQAKTNLGSTTISVTACAY